MRKDLKPNRINIDKRGKITSGIKAFSEKAQKEYPKAVDYFVIDDFPELIEVYGKQPKKLLLLFPSNNIENFFTADYGLYGSNNQLIRKCDGEKCIHRIDEEIEVIGEYKPNPEWDEFTNPDVPEQLVVEIEKPYTKKIKTSEETICYCKLMPQIVKKDGKEKRNPKLCNSIMYMKAYIVDYRTHQNISPVCYHFYSGSDNSAANIFSELKKIKDLPESQGRLAGLPFGLSVDMVAGRTDAKRKYPIWNLQFLGDMKQLAKAGESFLFDYREILRLKAEEEAKKITTGKANIEGTDKTVNFDKDSGEASVKNETKFAPGDPIYDKIKSLTTKKDLEAYYTTLSPEEQDDYLALIQQREVEIKNKTAKSTDGKNEDLFKDK